MDILPGSRIKVFDCHCMAMKNATVVKRYGYVYEYNGNVFYDDYGNKIVETEYWKYPDLVDVVFDHRPGVSKGHFTENVKKLNPIDNQ